MGKQFKASTKLTAKFLVVLMVLQAVMFSFTAFGADTTFFIGDKSKAEIVAPVNALTGGTAALIGVFGPVNATYKAAWTSSDTSVATVNALTGAVKATTKAGSVTITAAYAPLNLSDSITLNVYAPIKTFTLPKSLTVSVGQSVYIPLPLVLMPLDAEVTSTVYTITSTGTAPFTISAGGYVTASEVVYGKGTVTVEKFYSTGSGTGSKKATIVVTVPVPVAAIAISTNGKAAAGATGGINLGAKTTLKAIFNGGAKPVPTNARVIWTSSDITKVTIGESTGIIDLKGAADSLAGQEVTITATAVDTIYAASDSIVLTIAKPLKAVSVTKSVYLIKVDGSAQIEPILTSATANVLPTVTSVTYKLAVSADSNSIELNEETGVYKAIGASTKATVKINVTAIAADGSKKTTAVTVTVIPNVTGIVLTEPTGKAVGSIDKQLEVFSKTAIKTAITPSKLKLNVVRFSTTTPLIAFVNPYTGEVTGLSPGEAKIIATAVNISGTITSNEITIHVADTNGLLTP